MPVNKFLTTFTEINESNKLLLHYIKNVTSIGLMPFKIFP